MLIYSKTITSFIKRLRVLAKTILKDEFKLNVARSRFKFNNYLYPLQIVVFEKDNILGAFDYKNYQIRLNKSLMYVAKTEVIKNILRHELVHYIQYLNFGAESLKHDKNFREICKSYGYGEEVYLSYTNINFANNQIEGDLKSEKIISKIKKLLKLASSDNSNESELATIKANQLLLEHNINMQDTENDKDFETCVLKVLSFKKTTSKHHAIYEILKTFLVAPVFNHSKEEVYLEVIGTRTNVELSDYVANFLDLKLEIEWKTSKKKSPTLKKHSFMNGVAIGFVNKIKAAQNRLSDSRSLIILNLQLQESLRLVYPRPSHKSQTRSLICNDSARRGEMVGRNLNINPGIKSKNEKTLYLC